MRSHSQRIDHSTTPNGGYLIERIGSARLPWVVRFDDARSLPVGLFQHDSGRAYRNRRVAVAAAAHLEVLRERRIKLVRHVVMALIWAIAAVSAYGVMASDGQRFQVEWFAATIISVALFLNEALGGLLVLMDEGWDRFYEIRSMTRIDRIVASVFLVPLGRMGTPHPDSETHRVRIVGRL